MTIHTGLPLTTQNRPYVWRFIRIAVYTDITSLSLSTFVEATNWNSAQIVTRHDSIQEGISIGEYAYFQSSSNVTPVIPGNQQRLFGPPGGPGAANWVIHMAPPDPSEARPYVWRFVRTAVYTDIISLGIHNFVRATDWIDPQIVRRLGFVIVIEFAYFLSTVDVAPVIPDAQQRLFGPPGGPGAANWTIHMAPPLPTEARPYVWRFERIATYGPGMINLAVDNFIEATDWDGVQNTGRHSSLEVLRSPADFVLAVSTGPWSDAIAPSCSPCKARIECTCC